MNWWAWCCRTTLRVFFSLFRIYTDTFHPTANKGRIYFYLYHIRQFCHYINCRHIRYYFSLFVTRQIFISENETNSIPTFRDRFITWILIVRTCFIGCCFHLCFWYLHFWSLLHLERGLFYSSGKGMWSKKLNYLLLIHIIILISAQCWLIFLSPSGNCAKWRRCFWIFTSFKEEFTIKNLTEIFRSKLPGQKEVYSRWKSFQVFHMRRRRQRGWWGSQKMNTTFTEITSPKHTNVHKSQSGDYIFSK